MPSRRKRQIVSASTCLASWMMLGMRAAEMSISSAEVIARRTWPIYFPVMPRRLGANEARRMITEKADASMEAAVAMSFKSFALWQGMLFRPLEASVNGVDDYAVLAHNCAKIMSAGMMPFHRKARSNVKRLRARRT